MKKNEKKKFIRKSQLSIEYSILFAFKKNKSLRLYVDYRKLNNIIIKNRYLLFNINELQNKIIEIKFFTKLDLREVYNLIRMKTNEKWKITFRTRYNHYKYTIMSFEFINAFATCQKIINDALREYLNDFVIIYLNDILVYLFTLK